jgi:hypothetical protein
MAVQFSIQPFKVEYAVEIEGGFAAGVLMVA